MNRLLMMVMVLALTACNGQQKENNAGNKLQNSKQVTTNTAELPKTEEQWKQVLTKEQYEILRLKGTERPFTGEYYKHFEDGVYVCAACGNPLFESDTKFDSECGWPSFDQAIDKSVIYKEDNSYGMHRTEVMCAKCGGHLGHVFDDGPKETTGNRFCTNSVSIKFIPAQK